MKRLSVYLIVLIVGCLTFGVYKYKTLQSDLTVANNNNKAFISQIDDLKSENVEFQLTIDEMKYSKDSQIQSLMNTVDSLNIKNKKLQQLANIQTTFEKIDTLLMNDTIFVNNFSLDTIIGDDWIHNHIHAEYPSTIDITTCVESDKDVIVTKERQTVDPPKKFFICRWFQKKQDVVNIKVLEKNPHIIDENNVFIKIIK